MINRNGLHLALFGLAFAVSLLQAGAEEKSDFHTSPLEWKKNRVAQVKGMPSLMEGFQHVHLKEVSVDEIPARFEATLSPNKAYYFKKQVKTGPEGRFSDVVVYIYHEKATAQKIVFNSVCKFEDIRWISEKLIFARVWWKSLHSGGDYIFDVETGAFIYEQAISDGWDLRKQKGSGEQVVAPNGP